MIAIFFFLGLLGLGWPPASSSAGTMDTGVSNVVLDRVSGKLMLSADLYYGLSETAKAALDNGVPLYWNICVRIQRPRPLLWDETLYEVTLRYRLEYHALLNLYRVVFEHNAQAYNIPTLASALELMSSLRDVEILGQSALTPEQPLSVAIKVEFDRSSLPMPLRPFAYFDNEWDLSSTWTQWPWEK